MLREYQQRTSDQLYAWFSAGNTGNPCLVLPTGSGKSHIIAALRKDAERWRKLRDTPATSVTPGPLRGWLFSRPGGANSLDRMADALPAVGAA